jgi:uncharacterized protein with HEPN domain
MKQRDPGFYLEDIEYYANAAIRFVAEYSLEQYLTDEKTRAAVERVLSNADCAKGISGSNRVAVRTPKLWLRPRRATRRSR